MPWKSSISMPKPATASPFQSERSGKLSSSTSRHATCEYGESRETAKTDVPAAPNSSLLSRRRLSSSVQVADQSKR